MFLVKGNGLVDLCHLAAQMSQGKPTHPTTEAWKGDGTFGGFEDMNHVIT